MKKIATLLSVHGDTALVTDTLDAIKSNVGVENLILVDGGAWEEWGRHQKFDAPIVEGMIHKSYRNPCRNITLGLKLLYDLYPDATWYCQTEPDVLFTSPGFWDELDQAEKNGVWCIGNDVREDTFQFEYLENILDTQIEVSVYLLGCCVFLHKNFMKKLKEINFFNNFLSRTNSLDAGFFPAIDKRVYSFVEYLYPTLAHHFGGKVAEFACWNGYNKTWRGMGAKYPMRWIPELEMNELDREATILHPIKDVNHPLRKQRQENAKNNFVCY